MTDILTQLLGFKWRGISFPVNEMTLTLRQDLVPHKFFNRDGADVEATGRAPLEISATIPFRNGVVPGLSEDYRILYPDTYRAFLVAMADKSIGPLTHPELGDMQCRPEQCSTNWTGTKRDGVDVTSSWMETTEFDDSLQSALAGASPIAEAEYAALSLDTQFRLSAADLPKTPEYKPDLADTMRQISAMGDQMSIASNRVTGRIDALTYRIKNIKRSFARTNNPKNFPVQQAIERMESALRDVPKALSAGRRSVSYYRAPRDITMSGLAILIPARLPELIKLNPRLLGSPVVPVNTAVQFLPIAA